jgi:TrmH family RNA methyltransferase
MLSNAQLKHLQSLKLKKYRQNYAEFIIEGDKLITEALLENAGLKMICAEKEWFALHRHALPAPVPAVEINAAQMAKISSLSTPQQVLGLLSFFAEEPLRQPGQGEWILALDGISDPGNFGTIIRSADWFGVRTIVCSRNCVDLYNPKVIQASMGSIFRVKLQYTDLESYLGDRDTTSFATTLDGEDLTEVKFTNGGIILVGSESHGIRADLIARCNRNITIRKFGRAESLNAAVAAAIVLYAVRSGN